MTFHNPIVIRKNTETYVWCVKYIDKSSHNEYNPHTYGIMQTACFDVASWIAKTIFSSTIDR